MTVVISPTQKTCFDLPRATCNLTQDVVGMPALFGIAPPALQLTSGLTIVRGVTALVRGYDDVTQRANDVWKKVNGGLYIFRGFCDFVAGPINTFIAIAKNFAKWSPAALPVLNTIASIATAASLLGLAFQCGIDFKQATTTKDKVLSIALGVTASLLAVTILLGDILTVGGISKGLSIANLVLGGAFCIFDGMQLRDGLKATDQTKKEMLLKLMMVGATVLLSAGIFAAGQFLTGGTLPIILRIATMAVPIITTSIFCRKDIEDGCKWLKQKITPLGGRSAEVASRTTQVSAGPMSQQSEDAGAAYSIRSPCKNVSAFHSRIGPVSQSVWTDTDSESSSDTNPISADDEADSKTRRQSRQSCPTTQRQSSMPRLTSGVSKGASELSLADKSYEDVAYEADSEDHLYEPRLQYFDSDDSGSE